MGKETGYIFYLLAFYIFPAFCLFKIAQKTGTINAWMAWIPFLHLVLIFSIANKPPGTLFLLFIPVVNIYVYISAWIEIAKMFNEPPSLGIGAAFPLINIFPLYIFAFRSTITPV